MKYIPLLILTILLLSLSITPVKADTSVPSGKIDFGLAGPTQADFTALLTPNSYTAARGYGWTNSAETATEVSQADRGAGSGGAYDDLEQDIHYFSEERWFKVCLPNGDYAWTVFYGDAGYSHGPFDIDDNDGHVVDGLSTNSNEWKTYSGVTTVTGGYLYLKFLNPQNNASFNGITWTASVTKTTVTTISTVLETTKVSGTTTISPVTTHATTTKTGGTSTNTFSTSSFSSTISYDVSIIITSTISEYLSVTDVVAGTLTGYETLTTTQTSCSTVGGTSTVTIGSDTITTCITTSSIKTITGYVTSTSSLPVETVTIDGTSTSTLITATTTEYTSTTISGIVGGGCSFCIPLLMLVLVLFVGYIVIRRKN